MPWQFTDRIEKNFAATRELEWDNFYEAYKWEGEMAKTVTPPPHNAWLKSVYPDYYTDLKSGDEVNPDHFNRVLRIGNKAKRPLPHAFRKGGRYIVSEDWRVAIESLEPGVHQFIPLEVYDELGTFYGRKYYFLNIRNIIDAIDPDSDSVYLSQGQYNLRDSYYGIWPLLKEKFGNHHLWLQSKDGLGRECSFMSNELYKKIKDLRPQPLEFRKCRVR
jgi:hypothetical protein